MLLYCDITNEYMFFDRVWKFLADDIQYNIQKALNCLNYQMPENDLRNELLDRLAILFNKSGGNIHDFNLPQKTNSIQQAGVNRLVEEEMSYHIDHLLDESEVLISQLNAQQFDAFTVIIDSVLNNEPKFYFVSGYGGTGKTFLWNASRSIFSFNSLTLDTQIIPLYHNTPSSSNEKSGDFSSLCFALSLGPSHLPVDLSESPEVSLIPLSSPWPRYSQRS
jgi:hypothetical protein